MKWGFFILGIMIFDYSIIGMIFYSYLSFDACIVIYIKHSQCWRLDLIKKFHVTDFRGIKTCMSSCFGRFKRQIGRRFARNSKIIVDSKGGRKRWTGTEIFEPKTHFWYERKIENLFDPFATVFGSRIGICCQDQFSNFLLPICRP